MSATNYQDSSNESHGVGHKDNRSRLFHTFDSVFIHQGQKSSKPAALPQGDAVVNLSSPVLTSEASLLPFEPHACGVPDRTVGTTP